MDFSEPQACPSVFRGENRESHRNHQERRPGQNKQGNPDQENGCTDHRYDHTPDNFDVVQVPRAEQAFDRKQHE
jgi:hypothetical protein